LRVVERGENFLCGRDLLVFSAHRRRSNKIFDLQSKNHHNLFFCFRTLMRIANKCGGGRWKNLLVAEETSVVQHRRPPCLRMYTIHTRMNNRYGKEELKHFVLLGATDLWWFLMGVCMMKYLYEREREREYLGTESTLK
jgi:hypothetical protein